MAQSSDESRAMFERIRRNSLLPSVKIVRDDTSEGGFRYSSIFGLTSVMALAQDALTGFAHALYSELKADERLAKILLLLPAESYHITLRGLEPPLRSGTSFDEFERVDRETSALFRTLPLDGPIGPCFQLHDKIRPCGSAVTLGVEPIGSAFNHMLEASQSLVDQLGPSTRHRYHLSIGYLLKGETVDDAAEAAWANQRVFDVAQRLCPSRIIAVDPPKICYYESMEKFVPLFQ